MARSVQKAVPKTLLALGVMVVAAACIPYFTGTTTATVEDIGGVLTLRWSTAVDDDAGGFVDHYSIDIDGTVVAVDGPAIACELSGLSAGVSYDIDITAYDNVGDWSGVIGGSVASLGTVSTTHVAGTAGAGGGTPTCTALTDTDGDRLPDIFETNTGTYVDEGDTGTDPGAADTDGDSLNDGDEVLGTVDGLHLPDFGGSPLRQDILLEFDWFDDNNDPGTCSAHTHQPTATAISQMTAAFANAPVNNPDGSTGINVISDYGQGGVFIGGNLVPDADGVIAGGVLDSDFTTIKAAHLAAERFGYFRYVLMPHRYDTDSSSSGQAERPGDDMIVSLYCFGSSGNVSKTIMHELGHNLGLRHGGNDNVNYKPNYNSLMNYKYQFPGVDTNCTPPGNGVLDYSYGDRASLNELNLNENVGICSNVAWDWNGSGTITTAVEADINVDGDSAGDGLFTTLTDYDDWANVNLDTLSPGTGNRAAVEIVTEQPVPEN